MIKRRERRQLKMCLTHVQHYVEDRKISVSVSARRNENWIFFWCPWLHKPSALVLSVSLCSEAWTSEPSRSTKQKNSRNQLKLNTCTIMQCHECQYFCIKYQTCINTKIEKCITTEILFNKKIPTFYHIHLCISYLSLS